MPVRAHPAPSRVPREDPETALEKVRDRVDDELDEIARTHAGRPQPVVLAALEKAVRKGGVTPRRADLSTLAREISGHRPLGG
jgi:hypothetical protein